MAQLIKNIFKGFAKINVDVMIHAKNHLFAKTQPQIFVDKFLKIPILNYQ